MAIVRVVVRAVLLRAIFRSLRFRQPVIVPNPACEYAFGREWKELGY